LEGRTISHYRILEKIGEGGMGVVFKAEDTKLHRNVALKFIRSDALQNPELKARFLNEAEAAAALIHPNICVVHEIDEADKQPFIAMEHVEGESLAAKIKKRPLPLDEALKIAIQVAEGLQAAHEKGIAHRDIKPANVMLDPKGRAKVMDFGLAHLEEATRITKTGTIVGTPAYMSPEQVRGESVDHRADLWSLGVVIYEMVAGRLPFRGDVLEAVSHAVLHESPEPLTALRSGLPIEQDWIVGKALAKSPKERYQHADELVVDLQNLEKKLDSGATAVLPQAPPPTAVPIPSLPVTLQRRVLLPWLLFAVSVILLLSVVFISFRDVLSEAPLRRFALTPPPGVGVAVSGVDRTLAVSPNGRHIAFVGGMEHQLWVQDLDRREPRLIEGTEGAGSPFWSPDSAFIVFSSAGEVKRVPVQGGLATPVCELPGNHFHGGSWSSDGELIVFVSGPAGGSHSLYQVPARGGTASPLISSVDSKGRAGRIYWSHFLPSREGDRVLVLTCGAAGTAPQTMVVQDLVSGRREFLGQGAFPVYTHSGHLVYQPAQSTYELWALPFSLDTLQSTGAAFPIARNSRYPTAASDGTLVYVDAYSRGQQQLVWLNRSGGNAGEIGVQFETVGSPSLSPDGRLVAFEATEEANQDVWTYEIARGVRTRLSTAAGVDSRPVWSADGERVAFTSLSAGNNDIFLRQADGSGEEKMIAATLRHESVSDWSTDGKYLLYDMISDGGTGHDLWYLERTTPGGNWEPRSFLIMPSNQRAPKISPDGGYVAYVSDESGREEVYVDSFPERGRRVTISSNGGAKHRWSRDGEELFYVEGGETLMTVAVSTEGEFNAGAATHLFKHPGLGKGGSHPPYDVSPDGQQFLLAEPAHGETGQRVIRVVLNWFEEFRDRQ
jgi:eukaryotic-like serine/threonine-protein kinase